MGDRASPGAGTAAPPAVRSDVERNHRALIDAARELLSARPEVPMYEIARRAGVGQAEGIPADPGGLPPFSGLRTLMCTHGGAMIAIKVGVREFREQIARFLESDKPVAVTRRGETLGVYVPTPKKHPRSADVSELREAADRLAWGPDWADTGHVFTREDGAPLTGQWVSVRFETLAFRADLPPVRFHDLRHGAASLAKAAGLDSKYISSLLGHSRTSFTDDIYVSLFPEVAAEAAEAAAAVVPRKSESADEL